MPREPIYTKDETKKIKNKYHFGKCKNYNIAGADEDCDNWLTLTVKGDLWCNTGCNKSAWLDADRMFFDTQLKLSVPKLPNGNIAIIKKAWKRDNDPRNVDIANKNKPVNIPDNFLKASQDAVKEKDNGMLGKIKKVFKKSDDKQLSKKDLKELIEEHNDLDNFEMPKSDAQLAAEYRTREATRAEEARLERDKNRTPEEIKRAEDRNKKSLLRRDRKSQIYGQ